MDDLEFNEILEAKRHKETLEVLTDIANKLSIKEERSIKLLAQELRTTVQKLDQLIQQPKDLSVANEIAKLSSVWVKAINALKEPPAKEWEFDIIRDPKGLIQKVIATKQ